MEFFFEGSLHSVHDILYLGVLQRVLCVLEDEGKGIGFLARFEVLALIYVEQIDVLEQFLLGRKSSACEVGELNGFIHKKRKVTFYFRILRQIVDDCFVLFVLLKQLVPVEVRVEHLLLDIEGFELLAVDNTDKFECFSWV